MNAIPRVMAEAFGDVGFEVNTDIIQTNRAARTQKSNLLRLAVRPEFDETVEAGRDYILINDAIGQGGTISELRFFFESNGGWVVNISSLASEIYGDSGEGQPGYRPCLERPYPPLIECG